ncbi:hypothetical protein [Geobacter sp. AOG1]|uniref:hypothetical protein n=1 Tax=Geobacter sp. AOG1 TaxID=1566346 RepID=UPI001CC5AB7B|nr:hypothetical protein [Geobacter sp. AOG1]GFE59364.1 hypothetical protein AOG1_32440 [Geobacter sp. AOG1]
MMKGILFCIIIVSMSVQPALCYKANTHKALNSAVVTTKFSSSYLQSMLGYANVKQPVNGSEIIKWFENAGEQEDSIPRFINHFHEPISNSGYNGLWHSQLISGNPAPLWAQMETERQFPGGKFSWRDARSYFHTALTSSDKTKREQSLSNTFRAVGQVMHLMQDMSVPEHTRDTTHILNYTIENFVEHIASNGKNPYWPKFISLLAPPYFPIDSILLQQDSPFLNAPVPISNLFDAEKYDGTNPVVTLGSNIGLAEYSNANFFSFNTIFTDVPHPAQANVMEYEETDPATGEIKTFVTSAEVDHLAQTIVFNKYLIFGKTKGYTLEDDKIYLDYMQKLLPRAVGYSAALLDYFFRGKLEASLSTLHPSTATTISLMVKNSTPGEEMTGGKLALVLRYRQFAETTTSLVAPPPDAEYSYMVVELPSQTVPSASPGEYSFPLPQSFPLWTKDLAAQVVYQGTLGNEAGAVAVSPWIGMQRQPQEIGLKLPVSGVFAATTDSSPFTEIRVSVQNNLPDGQTMTDGIISLYLLYRTSKTNPFLSQEVISLPSAGYSLIKVTENNMRSIPASSPVEFVFDLSAMPLPLWTTDLYLYVVYQGTVSDGVTTRPNVTVAGMLDISEPTPVDVFNNADKICIKNQWYPAGSPDAIALSDNNNDGTPDLFDPYAHTIANIFAKASPAAAITPASASDFTLSSPELLAGGEFRRLGYILTDYNFQYSVLEDWVNVEPTDSWAIIEGADQYPGTAVKNQTDADGTYTWPAMYTIRGKQMWWGAGVVFDNDAYSESPGCDWSLLP